MRRTMRPDNRADVVCKAMHNPPDVTICHQMFPEVATAEIVWEAFPLRIKGTFTDGRHWYFRYGQGFAGIGIGESAAGAVNDLHYDLSYGGEDEGALTTRELFDVFGICLKRAVGRKAVVAHG